MIHERNFVILMHRGQPIKAYKTEIAVILSKCTRPNLLLTEVSII